MARHSRAIRFSMPRLLLSLGLTAPISFPGQAASAGPIAEHFKQWSLQRQTHTQTETPFSGRSSHVEVDQASFLKKLQTRLTGKSKTDLTTHKMTTTQFHQN